MTPMGLYSLGARLGPCRAVEDEATRGECGKPGVEVLVFKVQMSDGSVKEQGIELCAEHQGEVEESVRCNAKWMRAMVESFTEDSEVV